jgi:hypothetical protein
MKDVYLELHYEFFRLERISCKMNRDAEPRPWGLGTPDFPKKSRDRQQRIGRILVRFIERKGEQKYPFAQKWAYYPQ